MTKDNSPYFELILHAPYDLTISLSDALLDLGALSVTVEDADEGTPQEKPLFDEPGADSDDFAWDNSRIIALLSPNTDAKALVKKIKHQCEINIDLPYTTRIVPNEDWVRLTQSQFDPILIGQSIWIVPSWHDAKDKQGIILELDPGLAFGTGSHPTTRLCLEWLEQNLKDKQSVLDYGCGSGILAIAAQKLGASETIGVDIDQQAVETTQENAKRNHCQIPCYLPKNFESFKPNDSYNIVVANILAGPLQNLVDTLVRRIAPNGHLILSGILETQAQLVIDAYAPFIKLTVWKTQDGWVALSGQI